MVMFTIVISVSVDSLQKEKQPQKQPFVRLNSYYICSVQWIPKRHNLLLYSSITSPKDYTKCMESKNFNPAYLGQAVSGARSQRLTRNNATFAGWYIQTRCCFSCVLLSQGRCSTKDMSLKSSMCLWCICIQLNKRQWWNSLFSPHLPFLLSLYWTRLLGIPLPFFCDA